MQRLHLAVDPTQRAHPQADPERLVIAPAHFQLKAQYLLASESLLKCALSLHAAGGRRGEVGKHV